ncbi:MAG: bifunctional diaminohydroxyphosphoribosylaminopyrimidine deaminase/5-amino-6-(5-phosphoribosylamino)uracil reductase RibD [Pseudomonadota bacterium]
MARALELAEAGRYSTHPNPRVGCVIVKDEVVVGEGAHLKAGEPHAEVHALRAAGERARDAEVFVTLEPCNHHGRTPPCVDALIAAGVRKVWVAMRDPNPLVGGSGLARLQAAGIETEVGLLQPAAERLNRGFLARMRRQRPFVTLKMGASLDGRTAMASGESQWITGAAARADVHRLRAEAGAVLTSSATVLADDPSLTVRDFTVEGLRQPDRIVLDGKARAPADAKVWQEGARRFWLCNQAPTAVPMGVQALAIESDASGSISLPKAIAALAMQQVNHVLIECGPTLAGSFLAAGLVDELVLYIAPSLLGSDARGLAALPGLDRLDQRVQLQFSDVRQVGEDLRVTATLKDR